MDSINIEKIQALKKYKQQQFVNKLLFYPLAALTFCVFCTSPFWFFSIKTFMCDSIPRILSLFLSAKSLFIIGNLIVIFLVRESKVRSSYSTYNVNNHQVKILPKKGKMESKAVMKYKISPSIRKEVVIERSFGSEVVGLYTNARINHVEYDKDIESYETLPELKEETEQKPEERMWHKEEITNNNVKGKQIKESEEGEEELKDSLLELVIPAAFSTDELKRRADDFIAKVNNQMRLEADECLAF